MMSIIRKDNTMQQDIPDDLELNAILQVMAEDTLMVGNRDEDEQAAKAAGVDFIHADEYFK